MKILLQHTRNGLYLQDSGMWNRDMRAALDFGSSQRAIEYARAQGIEDVCVVAAFESGKYLELIPYRTDSGIESRKIRATV